MERFGKLAGGVFFGANAKPRAELNYSLQLGSFTYGATAVNAGVLYVNGSLGGAGVNVAGGAKLGGTGTINAPCR